MNKLVWGLPIRLFHWILLGLVGVSFYTGKFGDFDSIDNHMLAGYGIIALVLFRIMYGLFGRGHIRFTEFIKGPRNIIAYIKSPQPTVGHNPLGALGIIALLLSLSVQVGTGLFTTDEIFVDGPLYHLVSSEVSGVLSQIHSINQWVLLGLIGLHISAVAFHELWLKERILLPMIHGKKQLGEESQDQSHQFLLALICIVIAAGVTWYLVNEV